ncbi:hypothetical protein FRC09_010430 [Ceratobasidium sp. 395]|nr:hypothetical protein FRC09_010430 [Ceratobasidium sp. 395]
MSPTPQIYIIIFKDSATDNDKKEYKDRVKAEGGKILYNYDFINGFAAALSNELFRSLSQENNSIIEVMERDGAATIQG